MSIVQLLYGKEARAAILKGVEKANNAVRVTMGPSGRWVIFRHMGQVFSTKDGVTVCREVNVADPYEAIGADLAKSAAGEAVNFSGDGTTAAVLLTHAIFESGCKAIDAGAEPVKLCRGIARAVTAIVGDFDPKAKQYQGGILQNLSIPCSPELAFQAARISANGDESIGRVVSDAVLRVGVEGALTIGDSHSQDHVLEVVEGLQIQAGYAHPYLITDLERKRAVYENVTVVVLNRRLSSANEATGLMAAAIKCAQARQRALSILIICDDIDPEALNHIVFQKTKPQGPIPVMVVQAPLWGDARRELLEDICMVTGAKRIESPRGKDYESISHSDFGVAQRIVVTASKTILTAEPFTEEKRKKHFAPYIAGIRSLIEDEGLRPDERDAARNRLAALTGGVAVIKVGGKSADDVKSLKFQVEDAIHATRAAVSEGVVPGGGSALIFARDQAAARQEEDGNQANNADEKMGYNLLLGCLIKPLQQIAANAGIADDVVQQVQELDDQIRQSEVQYQKAARCGLDASTGEMVEDMIAAGIVDPLRVVRSSLNAAAACATMLLRTEAVIAHDPANNPQGR